MEGEIFQPLQSDNPNHRGGQIEWVSVAAGSQKTRKCMIVIDHPIDYESLLKFHTVVLGAEKNPPFSGSSVWAV